MKRTYATGESEGIEIKIFEGLSELDVLLLRFATGLIGFALFGSFILIGMGKLEIESAITLILAVSTIFSGLLGSAITYYFAAK